MNPKSQLIESTLQKWKASWAKAKLVWSPFLRLQEPIWCTTSKAAAQEGLTGSFAMIRLTDHRIVIDLEKVVDENVIDFSVEILAHEIGHHIYTPANLHDNAILMGRIRWALPEIENRAAMVANIYEDILINDKLQRFHDLNMADIYKTLNKKNKPSVFWTLIMRSFEYLWRTKRGALANDLSLHNKSIDADAALIASLIRSYSKNWLDGAGRFAVMLYPYLVDQKQFDKDRKKILVLLDSEKAGLNSPATSGLTELDIEGIEGVIDMRSESLKGDDNLSTATGLGHNLLGGQGPRNIYMPPGSYIDLMKQVNPNANEQKLINAYYKEIALPHLIDFPTEVSQSNSYLLPEGLETWNIGDSMEDLDWVETAIHAPYIIPGMNTVKRTYGKDSDEDMEEKPLDVYIGIDCSGSMVNPKTRFSWPVLAATIIGLSALRAGADVMACLSGEPGKFMETNGFINDEKKLLSTITSYLGTGYAYGIERLRKPFGQQNDKKSHAIIVTDNDIFSMLDSKTPTKQSHWELIEIALENAGGSGTIVLHSSAHYENPKVKRLQAMGWILHYVTNEEELLQFAADFSELNYTTN